MASVFNGHLRKLKTVYDGSVQYWLVLDSEIVTEINQFIGQRIILDWTGGINCVNCSKQIKKTYGEGFCFDCYSTAPEAAPCIIRPELCEAHLGKGRDIVWEQSHHNQPHSVYLAQTDGVKVGITRQTNVPGRWLDQGARRAIIFANVPYRRLAGEIEVELKQYISDKTDWRKMLTDVQGNSDLEELSRQLGSFLPASLQPYYATGEGTREFVYPVLHYPLTISSIKLEDEPHIDSRLVGIRGQYFIFEGGRVINIRKYTGFEVRITV
jgi:hypothetical protein